MGAWGYGYRDNDDYYNGMTEFVQPLIEALAEGVEWMDDIQEYRARFMWTVNLLMGSAEEISLSDEAMRILRSGIDVMRYRYAEDGFDTGFVEAVESEVAGVSKWLDGFEQVGFLEDRLGPLMEAVEKDE